ncbi:MAG: aminopeptidase P family protein [Chlorobi bacterium]|nr:aminopeptidase P family protein [Chlorobiota bacterium]
MFPKENYVQRRSALRKKLDSGIVILPGNSESSMNYPANAFRFRQDSNFLYFFGLDHPDFIGVIDIDDQKDYLFGDDLDMDDIIWMGPQPSLHEMAMEVGVDETGPFGKAEEFIKGAIQKKRKIHLLPPYRGDTKLLLSQITGIRPFNIDLWVSEPLIKAVIALRSYKDDLEIQEIEFAMDIAWEMHTTAMKMARTGVGERKIAGTIEGIALARGNGVSFPIILSINGQTLHNHDHSNILEPGRMMITDAGAESMLHYASDITRTVPVDGKFDQRQRDIYEIVLKANTETIRNIRPGVTNKNLHLMAARIITQGLKELGIMKGNADEAVSMGANALFFPHGLGHMMGLDVHDMEGLGENYVGYNDEFRRSEQFGLAYLRLAKKLEPGFVFTIEPGIYFIPPLFKQWRKEGKFTEFINYDKAEAYLDFGGIRIEDDVLVTGDGYRVLGKPIPKTADEIEAIMS